MINAAIVGLGRWGQILVNSVQGKSDRIRFSRGVTRTPSKVADYCRERDIALSADYGDALGDSEIDAVVLATPHTQHVEQIVAAAEAGKHVLCEKPFALTAAEARRAVDAVTGAGLKVATGYNRRFSPNVAAQKKLIDDGALGELIHVEGNFSANMAQYTDQWRASRVESPAGGMTSLGIHAVDAFQHLVGPMAEVQVRSRRLRIPFDIDDTTTMLMDFANGCSGYLGTIASTPSLFYARVFGTMGWAEAYGHDELRHMKADGTFETTSYEGYAYPGLPTVAAELEAFAGDIERGAPSPAATPEQIVHSIAVLEAIIASAETGESVAVKAM